MCARRVLPVPPATARTASPRAPPRRLLQAPPLQQQVIQPTIEGFKKDNINYQGFIFFGLIKVNDDPYVIEYNVRMGDPESEVVLPRIKSDLLELLYMAGNGNLKDHKIIIDDKKAATVFLVSGGYPEV